MRRLDRPGAILALQLAASRAGIEGEREGKVVGMDFPMLRAECVPGHGR